ncbi:MAG TPA: MFS transporter, partial [Anaerolineales bacterium]|nr:MFS transporter [Anaerolineales bacterium]
AAYANELAPTELKATSQGLLFAVYSTGAVFGSLLSGWLYDQLGVQGMFRTMAMLALAGFFLFVLGRLALHHRRQ